MALHRCVTNNAGQLYLAIEANCREASLTLWGTHSTSVYSSFELNSRQLVNYNLSPKKKALVIYYRGKISLRKVSQGVLCSLRTASKE